MAEGGTFSTVLSFTSTSAGTQKHRPSVSASKRCPSFRCAKHTLFTLYKKEPRGRRQTSAHTHTQELPSGGRAKTLREENGVGCRHFTAAEKPKIKAFKNSRSVCFTTYGRTSPLLPFGPVTHLSSWPRTNTPKPCTNRRTPLKHATVIIIAQVFRELAAN